MGESRHGLLIDLKDRVICRDRVIPIIEPIRPAIATIETPMVCEPSFEEEIISSPLPPTRRGSKRSVKPVAGLDEILIEESVPTKNQTFKRVNFRYTSDSD